MCTHAATHRRRIEGSRLVARVPITAAATWAAHPAILAGAMVAAKPGQGEPACATAGSSLWGHHIWWAVLLPVLQRYGLCCLVLPRATLVRPPQQLLRTVQLELHTLQPPPSQLQPASLAVPLRRPADVCLPSSPPMQQMGGCCGSTGSCKETGHFGASDSKDRDSCRATAHGGVSLPTFRPGRGSRWLAAAVSARGGRCGRPPLPRGPALGGWSCRLPAAACSDVRARGACSAQGEPACQPRPHLQGMHGSSMLREMQMGCTKRQAKADSSRMSLATVSAQMRLPPAAWQSCGQHGPASA